MSDLIRKEDALTILLRGKRASTDIIEAIAALPAVIREGEILEHIEHAKRLRRYDWQEWTAQDIEDAEGIICAFLALIQKGADHE